MIKRIEQRILKLVIILGLILSIIPSTMLEASATGINTGVTGLTGDYTNGTWSSSSGVLSGSASTSVSSGCSGDSFTRVTSTLTLTNSSGQTGTLAFVYTDLVFGGGTVTIDGVRPSGGNFSKKLENGESVAIVLRSNPSGAGTTSIKLSNIRLASGNVSVTFSLPQGNGSYTVDGTLISAETVINKSATESFSLIATPVSGNKFVGWFNQATNELISLNQSYSAYFYENTTVYPLFTASSNPVWQVGTQIFVDLNSAVSYAQSSSNLKTIILLQNGTLASGNYSIPNGKTVLIPFDTNNTIYTTTPEVIYGSHATPSAFRTLTMSSGAVITVQNGGAISVPSKLSAVGQNASSWNGTPTGPGGRIILNEGSSIVLNSGAGLYCYGYISGQGTVSAKSGSTVYEAFQLRSWRGGTATSNMKDNSQKVFPIIQYYVQNIEAPITFEQGASGKVYTSVNMSSRAYPASASFIGSGGLFQLSSGSLTRTFDGPTDRTTYEVNGNLSVTNMSLKIPGLPLIGTLNLDTADYVLPINSNISINIKSGTTTINQDVALLPATILTIDAGASLSVANGKRVYVYDKDEWGPYAADSLQLVVVGYSVANGTATKRTNANMVDSIVDVNGTLNAVNGKIYTTASGASITSSLKSGKVIITAGSETNTYQATQSSTTITYVDIPIESAKLHNGDDSYTDTAQANNTTYFYCSTHNKWETGGYVITFNPNGGTGTMPDQNVCTGENAINENTFTNEGLIFAGWNTKADGSGTSYQDKEIVAFTGNTTLYAQWTQHVHIWGEPSYQWSENNASVTATRVCQEDNTHVESETVETVSEETTAPSCTETGVRTYTATFTNSAFASQTKTETIAALGHDFGEWTVTTQPTCTEAGEETRTCTRCNAKETRPVDALGHNPGEARKENEVAATCTEKGAYDLVVRCTRCNEIISTQHIETDALGHTPSEAVKENNVDPTCTEEGGYDMVVYCSVCNVEISREHTTVPAKGHTAGEPVRENEIPATCTEAGSYEEVVYCTVCNAEVSRTVKLIEALGHNPGEAVQENVVGATCTEKGSYDLVVHCTRCNEIISTEHHETDALGHDFGEWTVTKEPTCTVAGEETRTCSRCDEKETRPVEALGHVPGEPKQENVKEATCTEKGSYDLVVRCTRCNEIISSEHHETDALGHDFGEWEITKDPTCTETGTKERTCSVCGVKETGAVDALGHNPGEPVEENVVGATCTEKGSYDLVVRCTRCNEIISSEHHENEALGHKPEEAVKENNVEPTCTLDGGYDMVVYCSVCHEEISRDHTVVKATGHVSAEPVRENVIEATCTTDGSYDEVVYCSVCDSELSRETRIIAALGHDFGEWTVTKQATCTEKGEETRECSRCHFKETRELAALGHDPGEPVKENEIAATCTEPGSYDEVVYCSVCNAEISRTTKSIPVTGHKPAEAVKENTVEPTCTQDGGYDMVVYCSVCHQEISREHTVVKATGHVAGEPVKENEVAPTCTADGSYDEVVYCTVCNEEVSRTAKTIPATGHDWSQPEYKWADDNKTVTASRTCANGDHPEAETANVTSEITKPASCEAKGETTYTAVFNNHAFTKQTKTIDDIPATGHSAAEAVRENNVDPTCTEAGGYDNVVYCSVCGKELSREHVTVPAKGHTAGDPVKENEKAATCTETGYYDEVVYCTECNAEISRNTVTIAALGHSFGEWAITKEPTCTENGEETRKCTRCDAKETRSIDALDHALELVPGKAATCTEAGIKDYYECSRCHDKFFDAEGKTEVEKEEDLVIAALGHDYGEWKQTKAPTCTEKGMEERECSRCHEKETREVAASGHTPGEETKENIVDATCTEKGSYDLVVRCTTCNEIISTEHFEDAALGHDWNEPEYVWSEDNKTVTATRTCKRDKSHVESETAEVKTEIIEATCEEAEQIIYTVEFKNVTYKPQRKVVVNGEALGHDLVFDGFTWNSDYSAAEGRFVCTRDNNHVEIITAEIDSESFGAETDVTASIIGSDGKVYSETKKVVESDDVIRVYGPNRYYTSIKTARYLAEVKGTEKFDRIVITTGENFADALAGSYLANKYGAPVILMPAVDKPAYEDVVAYINDSISENGKVYVLGGTSAIPEERLSSVNRNIERIQGANRYITNINILKKAGYSGGEILVCTGNDFADSLSASAVNMPILLVKDQLTDEQKAYLKQFSDIRFTIIGGSSAVSNEVEKELAEYGTVAERIAGSNRFATSAEIAKRFFPEASQAVLAYGRTFPDGLSGGPLAFALKAPLLLAESVDNNVVEATKYCAERTISSGTVLGGPTLIEDGFVRKVFNLDDNVIISEFE